MRQFIMTYRAAKFLLLLALGLMGTWTVSAQGGDEKRETIQVAGLHSPVEIIVDRWGISHISAENESDLFFAQGYDVARNRLFQLELWRRQATGTTAEILGKRALDNDRGARLLKFRGDMRAELNHYHPRGELIITSFVNGINAWIDRVENNPELLPVEFHMLGIKPGKWTPEVVISRHQGLVGNVTEELDLGRAVALLGPDKVRDLVWFHPGVPRLDLDPRIQGEWLAADILRLYRLGRSSITFRPQDIQREYRQVAAVPPDRTLGDPVTLDRARQPLHEDWLFSTVDRNDIGSNNWVVSGRRTLSGSAIMANDPHRVLGVPSLRHFVHLKAPGWNVIGGGEPSLPGISIGHNEHGAWGLTIFRIDAEDLYVYETHPDDPLLYRFANGWERMRVITESISVKGEDPVTVELKYTRHGPVLHEDPEQRTAFALRAGWLEVGGAPYLASLRMNVARNWEEFRDACSYSHLPGENMVWADRSGRIGWQAVGIAPLRSNWDGLVPVPGDGRYEWSGFLPIRALPHVVDPPQGFWNTSNEALVPEGYPHRHAVGWTWADPFRGARVREVLDSGRKLSMTDMMLLQQDELSIPARSLIPLLRGVEVKDSQLETAVERLRAWDFVLDRDSAAAGIYVMWERQIESNMKHLLVPREAHRYISSLSMKRIIDWLVAPDGRFGEDPIAGRDRLLVDSLREAIEELDMRFGSDMDRWHYGQSGYKHARLEHPLGKLVQDEWRGKLNVGPLPRGGNSYTVNNTGRTDQQPSGGSFRVIIDTGDWDAAVATNSPGQGGHVDAPHYADLFEIWAHGRYFPLLYSTEKIDSVRKNTQRLIPARAGNQE